MALGTSRCLHPQKIRIYQHEMEVMGPTDVVMHATNGTTIGNGCCGDNPFFLDVDRFEVHTGNISHWSSLKRRSTQNPATEVCISRVQLDFLIEYRLI